MTPERFEKIRRAVEAVREIPSERRTAFLEKRYRDDPELVREAQSLLAHDDSRDGFLEESPHGVNVAELGGKPSAGSAPPLAEGRLGSYRILSQLGSGGMGTVYRARDTKLGREVAIKVLAREVSLDADRLGRFEREAWVLAQLNHPNVATVHGLECSDEKPFLVMEVVEGETLAERIARGPVSAEEAIALFSQIAHGLEAAHRKGIVHRDLKPSNVKLLHDGRVKILDFGLAKILGNPREASRDGSATEERHSTEAGIILGTAGYMSPEQARGRGVDHQTDIWAFGCCLFEALTGSPAFEGGTVPDTLVAVLEREPDWSLLSRHGAKRFARLLERLLCKDPRGRLHDIADARLALEDAAVLRENEGDAPARNARWPLRVSGVAGAAAVATALASLGRREVSAPGAVTHATIRLEAALYPNAPSLAVSPDGRRIAYITRDRGLYVRSLGERTAIQIEVNGRANNPFFSSDGDWLGFESSERLMKASATGSQPVPLTPDQDVGFGVAWSDSGEIFVSRNRRGIWRAPEGEASRKFVAPDVERLETTHKFPESLPRGRALLFAQASADITSWDDAKIMVVGLEASAPRVLIEHGTYPRYSPTGHVVYARDGALYAVPLDSDGLEATAPPVRVLDGVVTNPVTGVAHFDIADNGTLVYAPGGALTWNGRIVRMSRDGTPTLIGDPIRQLIAAQPSPDASYLLLTTTGATEQLWLYEVERRALAPLTTTWDNFLAVWSPDGQSIAFWSSRERPGLYRMRLAAVGQVAPVVSESSLFATPTSYSPDGRFLLFDDGAPQGPRDIFFVSLDGDGRAKPFLKTRFDEREASFSPNGRLVAYVSNESGRDEVLLGDFDEPGRRWIVSTTGGTRPKWSPDGTELFFLAGLDLMVVPVRAGDDERPGNPRVLFRIARNMIGINYEVAPDGRSFYMVQRDGEEPALTDLNLVLNWTEELERLVPTS